MKALGTIVSILSGIITIIIFITGKASLGELFGDFHFGEFMVTCFKLITVYLVVLFAFALTFPVVVVDLIAVFLGNSEFGFVKALWHWAWNDLAIEWFWQNTSGNYITWSVIVCLIIGILFSLIDN